MDKTMQTALMKDFTAEQMGHKPATWCRPVQRGRAQPEGEKLHRPPGDPVRQVQDEDHRGARLP